MEFNYKEFCSLNRPHKEIYVKKVRIARIKELAPMYKETADTDKLEYRSNRRLRMLHRYIRGIEMNETF